MFLILGALALCARAILAGRAPAAGSLDLNSSRRPDVAVLNIAGKPVDEWYMLEPRKEPVAEFE